MSKPSESITADDREALARLVRGFVRREIMPKIDAWETACEFPRELYTRAGDLGLLGLGFPEQYGGLPGDQRSMIVVVNELMQAASGGLIAGLLSHGIGLPPIVNFGSEALKSRLVPPILRGERICALAITEPGGGSDVANLKTRARRDGDHYVVSGAKIFITSGMRADVITTAVRTGEPGLAGLSLLAIETKEGHPGLRRAPLKKMGWACSDTAAIYFDDYRVPITNRLGPENHGFKVIMRNFNGERLMIAAMAIAASQVCLDEAVTYARIRETFGRALIRNQVIRHRLVDMATKIHGARAFLEAIAAKVDAGAEPVAEVCLLKNAATECYEFCADRALQILGGTGYMRGTRVERLYRETKVLTIGGGAQEIMKELAARQLGW